MGKLTDKTIAFLATDGVEQSELSEPWKAVEDEDGTPILVSIESGEIQATKGLEKTETYEVQRTLADTDAHDFDGLVLPGGVKNPDSLRLDENAVKFVRDFFEQEKPVAAICHAPWLLVEADVIQGRTLTSYPSVRTDIRNAGGEWVDEEVVVDEGLTTSRNPDDLPAFCDKLVEEICEGRHKCQAASLSQ
jgi:protease I